MTLQLVTHLVDSVDGCLGFQQQVHHLVVALVAGEVQRTPLLLLSSKDSVEGQSL